MKELESYSIDELETLSGFDRRTVSYYITEGLLPRAGRRGPKTRYGREYVDRLKFIQRAKDLQDAGKLPSVTLTDIGSILNGLSAEEIIEGGKSNRRLMEIFAAGIEPMFSLSEPPAPEPDLFDSSAAREAGSQPAKQTPGIARGPAGTKQYPPNTTPGITRASERRVLYQRRVGEGPGASNQPEAGQYLEDSAAAYNERDLAAGAPDSVAWDKAPASFAAPMMAIHADPEKEQRELQELSEIREQLAQMRQHTQEDLKTTQLLAREVTQVRGLVQDEVARLRETLDELSYLRRRSERGSDGYGGRATLMQLQNRARIWARRKGIENSGPYMRVARLRPGKGGQLWEFPVDIKLLLGGHDLTVLCEGRPDKDADDFIALQIPGDYVGATMRPLLKTAGPRSVCRVSAEQGDFLQGVNCPGVDLQPFLYTVKAG